MVQTSSVTTLSVLKYFRVRAKCLCRGLVGATPQSVREMFTAGMTPFRPATAVLAASDDEDLDAEYRAKQPKGPFVSPQQLFACFACFDASAAYSSMLKMHSICEILSVSHQIRKPINCRLMTFDTIASATYFSCAIRRGHVILSSPACQKIF